MLNLKPYAIFAETVSAGSMSAAARRLGLTPSAVSQIIGNLERQTGVTLFHRATRQLTLTEAGERCLPHCLRVLEAGQAAAAALDQARDAPSGELRVAAPVGFGAHIAPALAPVLAEWRGLRLRLIVDDALIDLAAHRIDVALRVGEAAESGWQCRKLGDLDLILCAAPTYLARHGTPETPSDLAQHQWLGLDREAPDRTATGEVVPSFALHLDDRHGHHEKIDLPIHIATSNQIALQQMCEQGMGMARLFHADARPALERGALSQLLSRWHLPSRPVTMLTPARETHPAKVRVALTALERHFAAS
ncbi:LysR family transcriptional regulator [Novosphingopyxis sp.]|uniref:LysR family transcriptional regulator n=1 Tax=Novosphingopyxis sp. TaxID=2709690 RepID=UPI003B5BA655